MQLAKTLSFQHHFILSTSDITFQKIHIPATQRGVDDLDDNIPRILDRGDGPLLYGYAMGAFENDCFHSLWCHTATAIQLSLICSFFFQPFYISPPTTTQPFKKILNCSLVGLASENVRLGHVLVYTWIYIGMIQPCLSVGV